MSLGNVETPQETYLILFNVSISQPTMFVSEGINHVHPHFVQLNSCFSSVVKPNSLNQSFVITCSNLMSEEKTRATNEPECSDVKHVSETNYFNTFVHSSPVTAPV